MDEYQSGIMEYKDESPSMQDEAISKYGGFDPENILKRNLQDFLNVSGVIACSVFSEGISIESVSNSSFDSTQSIILAEDLLNSCRNIARERGNNALNSVTLEMDDEKLVVIPIGDAGLMILTKPNVSLGLLRLKIDMTIKNIDKLMDVR